MPNVEICFSPDLLSTYSLESRLVVVVDIFRASTTICTALHHGVKAMVPIADIEKARALHLNGHIVAGERDGKRISFASHGNSPLEFMVDDVKGKEIVYSTTNGTYTIEKVQHAKEVLIGCFANHSRVKQYLLEQQQDVSIICSGFRGDFSLEDALYAGALADELMKNSDYSSNSDALYASIELWRNSKSDLRSIINKCSHLERLKKLNLGDIVEFCLRLDTSNALPYLSKGRLVNLK